MYVLPFCIHLAIVSLDSGHCDIIQNLIGYGKVDNMVMHVKISEDIL